MKPVDSDVWQRIDDPAGLLAAASPEHPVALDLGCGNLRPYPDAIGVDVIPAPAVDVVADAADVIAALPDACVSLVYSRHFFEHLDDPTSLFLSLGRVVRPGGLVHLIVPHFSNPVYYSDPTHKRFFGLYTMSYLARDDRFHRGVPQYFGTPDFRIEDVHMAFMTTRRYPISYLANKAIQRLVNARPANQEAYELRWSTIWPCYEVSWFLRRM